MLTYRCKVCLSLKEASEFLPRERESVMAGNPHRCAACGDLAWKKTKARNRVHKLLSRSEDEGKRFALNREILMGLMRWYGGCPDPKPTVERDVRLEGAFADYFGGFRIRPGRPSPVIEIMGGGRWRAFPFAMHTPETLAAILEHYELTLRGTVEDWKRVEEIKTQQGIRVHELPEPIPTGDEDE